MNTKNYCPETLFPLAPLTIVAGHYGAGKTNFSLNLAFNAAQCGKQVTLVDLDIVNPYFRASDYADRLTKANIKLISPNFAGSSLDIPSLSGAIVPALESADAEHLVILDVGGDDAGATSLARFTKDILKHEYSFLYVINAYRNLTQTPTDAAQILYEIEAKSKLKATALVNNSHLRSETSFETIEQSFNFAKETRKLLDIALACTTIPAFLFTSDVLSAPAKHSANIAALAASVLDDKQNEASEDTEPRNSALLAMDATQNFYLVQLYVHTPWEQ